MRFHSGPAAGPTIIVFAREPIAGATKTRLIPAVGARGAAALADAFILDTMAKARGTGLPLVLAASTPSGANRSRYCRQLANRFGARLVDQGAGDLGRRMRQSLTPFCETGALLLGTDIPSLPKAFLQRCVALLRRHRVVIAPSLDGGYYLVGVRGDLPDIFRGIHWGTGRVLEQTLRRLRAAAADYVLADGWYDVDLPIDLKALTAQLRLDSHVRQVICPATVRTLRRLGLLA